MEFLAPIFWLIFLVFFAVCVVLMGIGLAIGLVVGAVACGIAGLLASLGVISVSTAVGLLFRSPAPAFRALVYQLSILGGIVSGIVLAWAGSTVLEAGLSPAHIAICGGLGGAAGGLVLALLFLWVFETTARLAVDYLQKVPQFKTRRTPALQD